MNRDELIANVDTIFIVMMENRSFDHVYGSRCLPEHGGRTDLEGITSLKDDQFSSRSASHEPIYPAVVDDRPFLRDIPHDRDNVATQLDVDDQGNASMDGFVLSYDASAQTSGVIAPPPMGILPPNAVPMSEFLARNFTLCDHWFCPIPTSTAPNRLMAMCGDTLIDRTPGFPLPDHYTLYHWLTDKKVPWRVYHQGLPFLLLMKNTWEFIASSDRFRRFSSFAKDVKNEKDTWPKVVFIEPEYYDSPIRLTGTPCDNHAPMPMAYGERFLHDIYSALIDSPRWGKSVLIYTYDEHGGFFDHVEPLKIGYAPRDNKFKPFTSTGPRVPAVVVSPMVGSIVRQEPFDHTSILQLLAERFGDPDAPISAAVTARRGRIAPISTLLDATLARKDIPTPPVIAEPSSSMMPVIQPLPHDLQIAFAQAALEVVKLYGWGAKVFPEIITWLHANK